MVRAEQSDEKGGIMTASTDSDMLEGRSAGGEDSCAGTVLRGRDRSSPGWARVLSWTFSALIAIGILTVAVVPVYLDRLVVERGETLVAPLLSVFAVTILFGTMALEYAHARALRGFRYARTRFARSAQAVVAVMVFMVLEFLHPALGLPVLIASSVAWLAVAWLDRRDEAEPLWDFLPAESVPVLGGRDMTGFRLAATVPKHNGLSGAVVRTAAWGALLGGFATAAWLAAREVIDTSAVASVALLSFWSAGAVARHVVQRRQPGPEAVDGGNEVVRLPRREREDVAGPAGLDIQGLAVTDRNGKAILTDVDLEAKPGSVVGIIGGAAAGKSMLLRALADPFSLAGCHVRGNVSMNDEDLWERSPQSRAATLVHVGAVPLHLPESGLDNLTCFHGGALVDRGRVVLEQLLYSADAVDRVTRTSRANELSSSDAKALALARAFLVAPPLYLFDRPEDGASEELVTALVERIGAERRAGRIFLLCTSHRALLETCDRLVVMHEGRIVDVGPAAEVRSRMTSGWSRLLVRRQLESEDILVNWIRSQFRRNGDEANRRAVSLVAAELLALSCQSSVGMAEEKISFEFKNFQGHCVIRLRDTGPEITSGQIESARAELEGGTGRASPLAEVIRRSLSFDPRAEDERRVIEVKVETYDPRKATGAKKANATPSA